MVNWLPWSQEVSRNGPFETQRPASVQPAPQRSTEARWAGTVEIAATIERNQATGPSVCTCNVQRSGAVAPSLLAGSVPAAIALPFWISSNSEPFGNVLATPSWRCQDQTKSSAVTKPPFTSRDYPAAGERSTPSHRG